MTNVGGTVTLIRGDNETIKLTVTSGGTAFDLTGSTLKFTVRDKPDGELLIQKTTTQASEINVTDAVNGLADIFVLPTDTSSNPGNFVFDVELTDSAGDIHTITLGEFIVLRDIT